MALSVVSLLVELISISLLLSEVISTVILIALLLTSVLYVVSIFMTLISTAAASLLEVSIFNVEATSFTAELYTIFCLGSLGIILMVLFLRVQNLFEFQ